MRAYDDDALQRLMRGEEHVQVNGADILLRKATTDGRPGLLDPWLIRRESELSKRPSAAPKPGLRTLLSMLFRPEAFLVQIRDRAEGVVLSPDADSAPDLSTGDVTVSCEELVLWKNSNTLWKYEKPTTTPGPRPAFIHVHGGGFFAGRPTGRDPFLKYVAERADAVVFDLDYSLSPENKFPHAVNETYAAVKHVYDHAEKYGIDRTRIAIGGGSGGGNLSAAASLMATDAETPVALQVLINPALLAGRSQPPGYEWRQSDYPVTTEMRKLVGRIVDPAKDRGLEVMLKAYRGKESGDNPFLSPMLAHDLSGLPRALVLTAEMDGLRTQGEFYSGQLAQADIPVRAIRYLGTKHDTPAHFGYVPQAEAIALEIVAALNALPAQ